MKDLYIKIPSIEALTTDLKNLSEDFVYLDEEGVEQLKTHSHKWAIHYIGRMVDVDATLDEEGNVVTEATYYDGEHANMRLLDEELITLFENTIFESIEFMSPVTPKVVFG